MSKRRGKNMIKLAKVRSVGKVVLETSRSREASLEMTNQLLSDQIAKINFRSNKDVLKVNKAGLVTNFDYNNPKHKRWLED